MCRFGPAELVLRRCLVSKEVLWVRWLGPDAGTSFLAETCVVVVVSDVGFALDTGISEAPPFGIAIVAVVVLAAQTLTTMRIRRIKSLKRAAKEGEEEAMDSYAADMAVRGGSV